MSEYAKIFCIIPAYNEEAHIAEVIRGVKSLVDRVVVVDDGSTDSTYDLAVREDVVVLRHLINRGQGAALETGDEYALAHGAGIVVHFDADGQFVAREIGDVVAPIIDGRCDVVFGSRFLDKQSHVPVFKKIVIMPIARAVNNILIGRSLSDPQCGLRAFSRRAASAINIENDGMAHNSEIQEKTFKQGLAYMEIPVTVIYHGFGQKIMGGKGRKTGGLRILIDLLIGKLTK